MLRNHEQKKYKKWKRNPGSSDEANEQMGE